MSFVSGKKRLTESNMSYSNHSKDARGTCSMVVDDGYVPLLPGLLDDVAKLCLALVPRIQIPTMGAVSTRWRSFIRSKEFITIRKLAGTIDEWLYLLIINEESKSSHWEVLDCFGNKHRVLPHMPGGFKMGFGVVVLHGKLLVMAGRTVSEGPMPPTADVYQYDSCLNSWEKLSSMNVARFDFACAEVDGMIYVVGGYGMNGEFLCSVEVYNPDTNTWTPIESLRRPRWGCFACGLEGKLYVMGGRSSFTIGNSKCVDVYNPVNHTWCEMKNGCVMVTAHAVLGKKLFCMEWKNQRKLTIFNPKDNSWKTVPVPVTGSLNIGFRFGILDGKLLLFSLNYEPGYRTLLYDPEAAPGFEWNTTDIKPSGSCLCSVTINA
ncbi:unnamed protein product [Amaranthus hypochondriacus]